VAVDLVRRSCATLPQTTEHVQWGDHLVFKVAGKLYAILSLEPSEVWISLKVPPEEFAELTEREGISQAPYLAKGQWVALASEDTVSVAELKRLIRQSYDLVVAKLPKKTRAALAS
jgi:predicted DNA-binding protein (MmcQ/YjbR family)